MNPLDKPLRNTLEKTVKDARKAAEHAAKAALDQLGVAEPAPYAHLTDSERNLRRRLRVHGRQLGDTLNGGKDQTMDRLKEEVAYQHWHRMLFARFLAENNLLMYPDPDDPVAVSLEECEDLAADEGAANGWELAARYAAQMLPQIFRLDSPVFELNLPPEHQQKLERLVADLPLEVFTASDAIGWVYQFWQARKKDEVNASEVKIGARELPAVTQLFTEPYMVGFLLDNSLGAWWVKKWATGSGPLSGNVREMLKNAETEEALRQFFSRPGIPLTYLRFVKTGTCTLTMGNRPVFDGEHWMPAAGWFDGWPDNLCDLKTLDPCCGSGHFLVATLLMLVPMRMELENLPAREAVDAVLQDNIHGLEIDQRCVELAAFALALTAWNYPDAGGYRILPQMNLACSGLSVSVAKEEWKAIAAALPDRTYLPIALDWMYEAFKHAPTLGSLLDPSRAKVAGLVKWQEIGPAIQTALTQDQPDAVVEAGVVAQGLVGTTRLLTQKYHLVITNVPYLARGKQSDTLQTFCAKYYKEGKNDLATVFLDRCLELCATYGTVSIVLPQNWLFLTSYRKFREKLLKKDIWHLIARLGPGAFETISGEVVKAILITMSRGNESMAAHGMAASSLISIDSNHIRGVDVSELRAANEKAEQMPVAEINCVGQMKQLGNPDARITVKISEHQMLMGEFADGFKGLSSGDISRFIHCFWESNQFGNKWVPYQGSIKEIQFYNGRSQVLFWESGVGKMVDQPSCYIKGRKAWGEKGITISQMGDLSATLYEGDMFDENAAAIIPYNPSNRESLFCFVTSSQYSESVRQIDNALKVTNKTLVKVAFDIEHWTKVAEEKYPHGLPRPYSDDPTQWIFHGHPCGSVIWDEDTKWTAHGPLRDDETVLHVAVARLLGYHWPAELDQGMELADEQREWVNRCQTLLPFADEDGIVCIPPVRGEAPAADRLLNLLAAAYGDTWSNDLLAKLLKNTNHAGKTLETWLRDKFFTKHCKLFKHRPFIWNIWDGLLDGFAALVNYHKLDTKRMETLIYTYLGDWINRQKQGIIDGVDGAQERLDAAESLMKKLELILEGESPYDIFVRWKPLDQQPIGWDPDLNDGVRLNIRPFMSVPDIRKKGAGVLRDKPNIKWTKDRGKDVESAPWYHLFKGDRINDHHLTLSEKRAARENSE
ncbi:Eco57I restriction-modification methylase domain-containing protein [Desulfotignum balticum]|uniref:Eco57I restriction-modification methylase domain-containing protein n=1 Tax=Desulfotignum balticum TaxID=115781 RepID=UPI000408C9F0|nr:N-6 DNA methylase [Desulfotignum balticum]